MSETPLRKWLKDNGIFDKDLEIILTETGKISDPTTDFKTLKQQTWDEIVRQANVSRAQDIKDNKSRMRMEEKLVKIENFWRQESGIEKTNIKPNSSVTTSSKETKSVPLKSQEDEKDAMSNASELKKWMQAEEIWEKDLLVVLTQHNVKSEDDVASIDTQAAFDEIIREVRVLRRDEIKDKDANMRLEKLLTKFEKLWRAKTGIQKTNIKSDSAATTSAKETKSMPLKSKEEEKEALNNASALKQWMQTEEIWEKDLFVVLTKRNVTCEDEIVNIDTQAAFDEVVREVTVLRRDETKDKDAKMRLEKLLAKFEKIWRSKTGIEKTNIKQSTSDKKKTPAPKDEENDKMETTGKALKTWMQSQEIWEKDLYDELILNNIKDENDLTTLTEVQFDAIVRKVRVGRFSNNKDQQARQRLDKLLINFERLWREKSGIEKTNIKK